MTKDNALAGRKILIAEDDESSFYLLEFILEMFGAEIIHTRTGDDTIQTLLDDPYISLILMDIRMPGMNGFEATRKIRELKINIPIIAQTALILTDEKIRIMEAGCNDYISKPIDRVLLLKKIKQLLS